MTGLSRSSRDGPSGPRGRNVELAERMTTIECADVLQVPTGTEGAAFAIEHGDARRVICIEVEKSPGQRVRALGIHGVARLATVVNDGPYVSTLFDSDGHDRFSSIVDGPERT